MIRLYISVIRIQILIMESIFFIDSLYKSPEIYINIDLNLEIYIYITKIRLYFRYICGFYFYKQIFLICLKFNIYMLV